MTKASTIPLSSRIYFSLQSIWEGQCFWNSNRKVCWKKSRMFVKSYIFSYKVKNNLWEKSDILFYRALIFWLVDNWGLQLTIGMKVFLELYSIHFDNSFLFCFQSLIKYLTPATNSELRILNFHNILMIRICFWWKNQKHYLKKTSSNWSKNKWKFWFILFLDPLSKMNYFKKPNL